MKYQEVKGDLFSSGDDVSLTHCISEDCRMGKGIAVLFKNKYGGEEELKRQVASGKTTGHSAVLKRKSRFVYYLITKKKYSDKPTYDSLRSSLQDMKLHILANQVDKLALPKIGCGLDGLKWDVVAPIIRETFDNTDIVITVYYI